MTRYGYFECRAQLQKSPGVWAAFWIQSAEISKGEDPAKYGAEIDIMEGNKSDAYSNGLHWDSYIKPAHKSNGAKVTTE